MRQNNVKLDIFVLISLRIMHKGIIPFSSFFVDVGALDASLTHAYTKLVNIRYTEILVIRLNLAKVPFFIRLKLHFAKLQIPKTL